MKKVHLLFTALAAVMLLASCGGGESLQSKIEYIPFKSDKDNNWGLISPEGKVLFDDEFEKAPTMVMNGRFFVESKEGYELYAAEEKPKQVGNSVWKEVCDFTADVTPAVEKGKSIVLINRDGEVVKEMGKLNGKSVLTMQRFSEGYSVYQTTEGYYGLVNTDGEVVIDAQYVALNAVSDGKLIGIDKKYEAARKAGEKEKIKISVLDTKGNVLGEIDGKKIKEVSGEYADGLMPATVEKGEKTCAGLLNEKGEWEVEPTSKAANIHQVKGKKFAFSNSEGKCGIMTFDGEVVVRAKYDGIFMMEDDVFAVCDRDKDRDERWHLINAEGEKIGTKKFRDFEAYGLGNSKYAIVEVEEDNYAFLGADGEYLELEKGVDIYQVRFGMAGGTVESDYVDMNELAAALGITKEGLDGFKVGMGAEAAIKQAHANDSTISADAEQYAYSSSIQYSKDLKIITAGLYIGFDSYAGEAITETVTENYYGYTFTNEKTVGYKFAATAKVNNVSAQISTNYGKLQGKGKDLYKALAAKFKSLGKEIKSNDNAVVVSTGEGRYGVVLFTGNEVAFGIVAGDGQTFDISQYANVSAESPADADISADEEVVDSIAAEEMEPDDYDM